MTMKNTQNDNADAVHSGAWLGAIKGWFVQLYWNRKFKRWLKETPEDDIIAAHIKRGFKRWDSGDGKLTVLRKGETTTRITRDEAPNDSQK